LAGGGGQVARAAAGPAGVRLLELSKEDLLAVVDHHPMLFDLLGDRAAVAFSLLYSAQ